MIAIGLEKSLVETAKGTIVPVQAVPQGSKFAVVGFDEWNRALKVRLRSKAEKGKANKELAEGLKKAFNAEVEIVSGKKARLKKVLVHAPKERVLKSLSSL